MVAMPNTLAQVAFRGRNDDGSETDATWIADTNVDWSQRANRNFRLRIKIDATAIEGRIPSLWYSINGSGFDNRAVTTSSSVVKAALSPFYTDGDDTTEQLPNGGFTYITVNAGMINNSGSGDTITYPAESEVEVEWCLQIVVGDVKDGDVIELRVQIGNTVLLERGYFETPSITVDAPRTIRRTLIIE